jgi:hypothetical protein
MNASLLLKLSAARIDVCFHRIKIMMQSDKFGKEVKMSDFLIEGAGINMRKCGVKSYVERYWLDEGCREENGYETENF